jgi:uncharacterized Ntn-hydrolase superfamily protein
MTFSIVACDLRAGDWGVAVASKFPAVGAVVPWARAPAGAVATQSWANTSFGPTGLELMGAGLSAEDTMARLLEEDDDPAQRQVGLVDVSGGVATFTGDGCMGWAGGRTGEGYACQGNILAGEEVVIEMARTFEASEGDLLDRLLASLLAGDRAGGDRRGRQSAALLVVRQGGGYGGFNDRWADLRVDDHPEAPAELARVVEVYDRDILIRHDSTLEATPELVTDLQRRLIALGRLEGEPTGTLDVPTREAFEAFAGELNMEGKLREDDLLSASLVREIRDVTPEIPG